MYFLLPLDSRLYSILDSIFWVSIMDKRYQVFVSSTYVDLEDERQKVIQTLMKAKCIPAGMEFFNSVDMEQFEFIKTVIDDCDYYLLIIGGRYGSIAPNGKSFTELEYDYAVSKNMKVMVFIHSEPGKLARELADDDPEAIEKLAAFREKAKNGRLVDFYKDPKELPGLVALSLLTTMNTYPAVGWVRGDAVASSENLQELLDLKKENEELKLKLAEEKEVEVIPDLADLDDVFDLEVSFTSNSTHRVHNVDVSWREIFRSFSSELISHPNESQVRQYIATHVVKELLNRKTARLIGISDESFRTISVQLEALGLVKRVFSKTIKGNMAVFWVSTQKGQALMLEDRTVRKSKESSQAS